MVALEPDHINKFEKRYNNDLCLSKKIGPRDTKVFLNFLQRKMSIQYPVKSILTMGNINSANSNANTVVLYCNISNVTAVSASPSSVNLVSYYNGTNIYLKNVVSGTNTITVTDSGTDLLISQSSIDVILNNASSVGQNLVVTGKGPALSIRSLSTVPNANGSTVVISSVGNDTTISQRSTDVTLTTPNAAGTNLVFVGQGPNLLMTGMQGNNTTYVSQDASNLSINYPITSDLRLNSANNDTLSINLSAQGQGPHVVVKTLTANNGLTLTSTATTLNFNFPLYKYWAFTRLASNIVMTPNTWSYALFTTTGSNVQGLTLTPGISSLTILTAGAISHATRFLSAHAYLVFAVGPSALANTSHGDFIYAGFVGNDVPTSNFILLGGDCFRFSGGTKGSFTGSDGTLYVTYGLTSHTLGNSITVGVYSNVPNVTLVSGIPTVAAGSTGSIRTPQATLGASYVACSTLTYQ